MALFTLLALGLALYLYSIKILDAPISATVRSGLTACRLVFIGLTLFLLTLPQIREIVRHTTTPTLWIAIDDSRSMNFTPDPDIDEGEPSRYQHVLSALQQDELLKIWEKKEFQFRYSLFSTCAQSTDSGSAWSSALPKSATPSFDRTDLESVIQSFQQQRHQDDSSYLLLFTDGQWNFGGNPIAVASALNAEPIVGQKKSPIYTFGIGAATTLFDVVMEQAALPEKARANENLTLRLSLSCKGDVLQTPLTIRVIGESQTNEQIYYKEQTIELIPGTTFYRVPLEIPPLTKGDYLFTAEALPLAAESSADNNRISRGLRIDDAKDPVLLLTSAPDAEFKLMKRTFEDHPTVDPQSYLILENRLSRLGDRAWISSTNPASPNLNNQLEKTDYATLDELASALDQYAVIVLHNLQLPKEAVAFAKKLQVYAANGGGILFVPGSNNRQMPPNNIAEALPAPIARMFTPVFRSVKLNRTAKIQADFFNHQETEVPPLPYHLQARPPMAGEQTLVQGSSVIQTSISLVSRFRYGLGRILVMGSSAFWQWEMLTDDDLLAPFWMATLVQCNPEMRPQRGQLMTDGFLYETMQPVRISYYADSDVNDVTLAGTQITVQGPARQETVWLTSQSTNPSLLQSDFTPAEPGNYTLTIPNSDTNATFVVETNPVEISDLRQNITELKAIANITNGGYANSPAWKQLAESIPEQAEIRTETQSRFLGESWWMSALLILFLGLEWFIRWRKGLP